jgi:hypothetical protein
MIKGAGILELFKYDYLPDCKYVLDSYGDISISKLYIVRSPINSVLQSGLKPFNKTIYDKLFHLYIVVELSNKVLILIEKNEVINIVKINKLLINDKTEYRIVKSNISSINDLLNNTRKLFNEKLYFGYDMINNCQKFILMILESNGLYEIDLVKFVKQDTETIFRNWPTIRNVSNFFVRLYGNMRIFIN